MGKEKKLRACPAVKREITSAECGENRLSRYACPEECPFNPFQLGIYSALLALEDVLDAASVKRMDGEDATTHAEILKAGRANQAHGWHAAVVWHLYFKRDESGRTFAERWEQAGFPGLKNDERVFVRHKMKMRVALLELHRVLDEQRFEAVDLLDATGPTMILVDRSMAGRAVRFFTCLIWIYPLPHFWRLSGTAISTSDLGPFPSLEMIEACVTHLGGPAEAEARRRWLAENFTQIDDALMAIGLERRRQMFAAMDASWGTATYELRAPLAAARKALAAEPAVTRGDPTPEERDQGFSQALVWFDDHESAIQHVAQTGAGRAVLGRVLLGKKECRLEAMGTARLARLRAGFERRMGAKVQFSRERQDDLAGQMAAKDPAPNLALVPPRLLEAPSNFELSSLRMPDPPAGISPADQFAETLQGQRWKWIDEPVPALDGRTPRDAARDPAGRARVIELVKGQVRQGDRENLKTGRADDINGLIRELGLAEIDFPPPPPRKGWSEMDDDEGDQNDDADSERDVEFVPDFRHPATDRPPVPRLVDPPLTFEVARERLDRVLKTFEYAGDALDELADSGATVVDDLSALTEETLDEMEFNFFVIFVFQAWFALVPRGVRAPRLDFDAMTADFARDCDRVARGGAAAAAAVSTLTDSCRQPGLLTALINALTDSAARLPKQVRPSPAAIAAMILALRAMVDELDRALRWP